MPEAIAGGARIVSYGCDEPQSVAGSGNTDGDLVVLSDRSFKVRAERTGTRNGRVCTVEYAFTNPQGATSVGVCKVGVPHEQSGRPMIDDGYAAGWSRTR